MSPVIAYLLVAAIWAWSSVDELVDIAVLMSEASEVGEVGESIPLSVEQIDILLQVEDPTFYTHIGVDISRGQGLTTITSSLAPHVFLDGPDLSGLKGGFQRFYRKVYLCCKRIDLGRDVMAMVLNANLSKEEQLGLFIRIVYMGRNEGDQILGLSLASREYFDTDLAALSRDQFIALVAMLRAPNRYHPTRRTENHQQRVRRIQLLLGGECRPSGILDTDYLGCDG